MSVLGWLKSKGPSGFGYASSAEEVTEGLDLHGRNILVTGSNSGLGHETVRVLALRGARLFAAARSLEKARNACAGLAGEVIPLECELSEPKSVRGCVESLKKDGVKLDVIIANAGIMALPELKQAHGIELQFFTNHVGHFLLITGLLSELSDSARIVMLSSAMHTSAPRVGIDFDNLSGERGYRPWQAYGQSKLANILFAKELKKRFSGTNKRANAVHPGVIKTNLGRSMHGMARLGLTLGDPLFMKSIPEGAATQCYVATQPKLAAVSGEYFADCNITESSQKSRDAALATRLWEETERIVQKLG